MKIKPLFDRVLARIIKDDDNSKTLSGIQLLQKEEVKKANVVAVGQNIENSQTVKPGDTIYFEDYVVANLKVNHEDFILIKATDILAVKEDN